MNQRRIFLLYGRDQGLEINNSCLKLYQLGVSLCRIGRGAETARKINQLGPNAEQCNPYISHIHPPL
jgi:hypothetical protein